MKKINVFVLAIAMFVMSAMFLFAACSNNNAPLVESIIDGTPFDDSTRSDTTTTTTNSNTSENDTTGGSTGGIIIDWETCEG